MASVSDLDILELIDPDIWQTALVLVQLYTDPERVERESVLMGVPPDSVVVLATGHLRTAELGADLSTEVGTDWAYIYDDRAVCAADTGDEQLMACLALRRTLDPRPTCRIVPVG